MIDHFTSKEINLVPVLIQLIFINICVFFFFLFFRKAFHNLLCAHTLFTEHTNFFFQQNFH